MRLLRSKKQVVCIRPIPDTPLHFKYPRPPANLHHALFLCPPRRTPRVCPLSRSRSPYQSNFSSSKSFRRPPRLQTLLQNRDAPVLSDRLNPVLETTPAPPCTRPATQPPFGDPHPPDHHARYMGCGRRTALSVQGQSQISRRHTRLGSQYPGSRS